MNILATSYSLEQRSLDIYLAGCNGNPHCVGCHNPESWDLNQGEKYTQQYFDQIAEKVKQFDGLIENIMIFGGEPLDQDIDELLHFLFDLNVFGKKIWLFTRYNFSQIPKEILNLCHFVKTGRFIQELRTDDNIQYGIKLATSNQNIIKIRRGSDVTI